MSTLAPIGTVRCAQRYRYEAPRQGVWGGGNEAIVELHDDPALRQGLTGLAGFARLWVVYLFHHNSGWRPFVQPPRADVGRVGVFATRSPHRPNPLGLSCVELVGIDGGCVHIRNHDLLDGTPVLDLKPYVPYADAFPDAAAGWLDGVTETPRELVWTPAAAARATWVATHAGLDMRHFAQVQLRHEPTAADRKRIAPDPERPDGWVIAYRTWRLHYTLAPGLVTIHDVRSGYSAADLDDPADRHHDKASHRAFLAVFPPD